MIESYNHIVFKKSTKKMCLFTGQNTEEYIYYNVFNKMPIKWSFLLIFYLQKSNRR